MRLWQDWWHTLIFSIQNNPPEFVEYLMVSFATALAVTFFFTSEWPYLVLSSSFALGAAVSMWVRELMVPSPRSPVPRVFVVTGLVLYSLCAFDVVRNYL